MILKTLFFKVENISMEKSEAFKQKEQKLQEFFYVLSPADMISLSNRLVSEYDKLYNNSTIMITSFRHNKLHKKINELRESNPNDILHGLSYSEYYCIVYDICEMLMDEVNSDFVFDILYSRV